MNEKIRQLAEQADRYAVYVTPQGLEWFDNFKEKFAELIIKECVENIELFDHHINPASEVVPTMVYQIKQHFGVE